MKRINVFLTDENHSFLTNYKFKLNLTLDQAINKILEELKNGKKQGK